MRFVSVLSVIVMFSFSLRLAFNEERQAAAAASAESGEESALSNGDTPEQRAALEALAGLEPVVKRDESLPGRPVVAIHFLPNFGAVTDDLLARLRAFPELRSIRLANKRRVTDIGLAQLAVLDRLEDLDLNGTSVSPAVFVRFVAGRTQLRGLNLTGVPLRDEDLAALVHLTNLQSLSLRGSLVTSAGLAHLRHFTRLRNLSLMSTAVDDAGLASLAGLTDLEDLDLDRTAMTDAGLVHLAPLVKLRRLQFAHTKVTDAGLEHLRTLSNLRSLNVRATQVSQEGLDKLRVALPQLQGGPSPVVRDVITGPFRFPDGKATRIVGHVQVLDAHTLRFTDGAEVELNGGMDAPDLAQEGQIGDSSYPCGKEAAEFLRNLIGDQPVTCHIDGIPCGKARGDCFVGEKHLQNEMVRNGWALSHHSGTEAWEMFARENRRGLWRGKFVMPERWRKGERLAGELAQVHAAEASPPDSNPANLLGTWNAVDRHVAIGSLYQRVHGVRKRTATVHFQKEEDRLIGYSLTADHKDISFQEKWKDGRTSFRNVQFADGRLVVEFDIGEWRRDAGPLAVEDGRLENKGTIRIEAQLKADRLIGTWDMFTADGRQVFRGEWEAVRANVANAASVGAPAAPANAVAQPVAPVVRDQVKGSIHHGGGKLEWRRIIGKVSVLDARTLEFSDGTRIDLGFVSPELNQMALNGDSLYPVGKEAADFLRKVIGDLPVICLNGLRDDGPWHAFAGDTNLERAMVVNGWALADHSTLQGDEIIARENSRGLWHGRFVNPEEWRVGVRLPEEPPASSSPTGARHKPWSDWQAAATRH